MSISTPVAGTAAANTSASTTLSVPYPSGITAGDVLVLYVGVASSTAPTNPSGTGFSSLITGTSGGSSPAFRVSRKIADGSETGNVSVTTPNATSQGRIWRVSGVDQVTPVDVSGTTFGSSTAVSAYDIPTLTTTRVGVMLFVVAGANSASGVFTEPTSPAAFTEIWDSQTCLPSSTASYLIWSSSGATGTVNQVRPATTRGFAGMIALRPAGSQQAVSGTAAATSAVSGSVQLLRPVSGTVAGTSGISGVAQLRAALSGTAASTSGVTGAVGLLPGSFWACAGQIDAITTVTGQATARIAVSGTAAATSGISGAVGLQAALTGTAAATSALTGSVGLQAAVSGTTVVSLGISGVAQLRAVLTGSIAVQSGVSGAPALRAPVTGTVACLSQVIGNPTALLTAEGTVVAVTTAAGSVLVIRPEIPLSYHMTSHLRAPNLAGDLRVPSLTGELRDSS